MSAAKYMGFGDFIFFGDVWVDFVFVFLFFFFSKCMVAEYISCLPAERNFFTRLKVKFFKFQFWMLTIYNF
jgi:hypothetical protein